ncbi:MAG: hypothetical protein IJQ85_00435 [Selenomonadaceae bacterium]|nr:hypothetical protein [Selenomonadaceae bacterium]
MKKFFAALICLLIMSAQVSAMNLTLYESVGSVSLGSKPFELKIEGYTKLDGNFSKGVAIFNGNLYFHFDAPSLKEKMPQAKNFAEEQKIFDMASRFGSSDFSNTVPVFVFEGMTKIYPMSSDDGRKFYLLATETGGGGSMKVIGDRNGTWVKYFDTLDMRKQMPQEFYLENFYAEGDTIIFLYKQWQQENFCELRYKWNENNQWFGVELIYR